MINKNTSKRESGLDLLRVCASFFVVAVHFYLNCGYYNEPLIGSKMFIMTVFRWFFMISVPLFIMLTGYLKLNNTVGIRHYKGLFPILVSYIVICIFKVITANRVYGEGYYSLSSAIKQIASYQMAWYVGMYVALMLLIPFLNILWKALPTKKEKLALIISLAIVSTLYPVTLYIVPSYFQMLYPFVYYFLGCYVREYRPVVRLSIGIPVIIVLTLIESGLSFYFAKGGPFRWDILCSVDSGYSVITLVICTFVFFAIVSRVNLKSELCNKVLCMISSVSLEIYLYTGIFDAIIFSYLKRTITTANGFFWWAFITIPLNFILSAIAAIITNKLLGEIIRPIMKKLDVL